jgi:DNA-directed RNA polymerase subunit beta'
MSQKFIGLHKFTNALINKRNLKNLMYEAFLNYGIVKSSMIADRVKNLTFHYATKSGISLSVEDLRIPPEKRNLLGTTINEVEVAKTRFQAGDLTTVERYQKTVDIWNNANNFLKEEVITYFRESDPLNPLYIMAFSGARGNISQVRQLVGMRGLMADPQGQIIDLPIKSNFREGLSITEYIISSYGARKGLVDTALRTADSGYLTRRLVDVAQDIIVREEDCGTSEGLSETELNFFQSSKLEHLLGRLLASPLLSASGALLAPKNTEITLELINQISNVEYKNLKVRSPLTCNSTRSICRNCYGWHLSYSKLVDLGEAIGIIAAQSIGEPGTQLTMRTFHTGGVFSGDLNQHIRSPFPGQISYDPEGQAKLVRTMYGETGFQLKEKLVLVVENQKGTKISFSLPAGSLLFANKGQKVYTNEILAAIQKETNLISEENQEEIFSVSSGEVFFPSIKIEKRFDKQNNFYKVANSAGLIWILQGQIHKFSNVNNINNVQPGLQISPHGFFNRTPIINSSGGKLQSSTSINPINITQFSVTLKNGVSQLLDDGSRTLKFLDSRNTNKFSIDVSPQQILKNGDVIATLIDNQYKVETGGFVTYSLDSPKIAKKKKSVKALFSGYCYFIPEETYYTKNTLVFNTLNLKTGDIVEAGSELFQNVFSKTKGYAFINEADGEICIKSGELFDITGLTLQPNERIDRFVQPGEFLLPNRVIAQKLVYVEYLELFGSNYIFIRPVTTYEIPREKTFFLKQSFFPKQSKFHLQLKVVKRVRYKNWQKILPNNNLHLITTNLVLELKNPTHTLQPKLEFQPIIGTINQYSFRISLNETVGISEHENTNHYGLVSKTKQTVNNRQYLYQRTLLAHIQTSVCQLSVVRQIDQTIANKKAYELLVLNQAHLRSIEINEPAAGLFVKLGDLVKVGTLLGKGIKSPYSGQIYQITDDKILIRLGQPVLISKGTILHVENGALIKKGDRLATLIYEKLKTTDIVQGLPKVEEILEARKIINTALLAPCPGYAYVCSDESSEKSVQIISKNLEVARFKLPDTLKVKFANGSFVDLGEPLTDGIISPHAKLEILFAYYRKHYNNYDACKLSFKYLQLFLVQEIQATYRSQGVDIDNKHIEIIVKQMTRKISIETSGTTTLLPGEVLNFQQIEGLVKAAELNGGTAPSYTPILLGLTKASLNSDSFISAASFQETTRVLTEAAIEGRKDWLNGLKENVIIGRLIPAGTGFDYTENQEVLKRENLEISSKVNHDFNTIKENVVSLRSDIFTE